MMERRKDTAPGICRDRYLPENVTIEIYVISDEVHNRRFTKNDLWRYICIFINSINAIFMSLSCPKVRLALVGLEISSKTAEAQYVYGSDKLLNDLFTLYNIKDYVDRKMEAYRNPDLVLLLTGRDIYESTSRGIRRDITGIAFEGGVCTEHRVALAEDVPGSFSGIIDAAHELGHSLGASHDGSPPNRYIPEVRYVLRMRGEEMLERQRCEFLLFEGRLSGRLTQSHGLLQKILQEQRYVQSYRTVSKKDIAKCDAAQHANPIHSRAPGITCLITCGAMLERDASRGVCRSGMHSSSYRSKKF
ncbi:hypothetical protein MRX96_027201 [Rhipicephalus microplus]